MHESHVTELLAPLQPLPVARLCCALCTEAGLLQHVPGSDPHQEIYQEIFPAQRVPDDLPPNALRIRHLRYKFAFRSVQSHRYAL